MTSYRKYNVNLTDGQKEKLRKYFQKRSPMILRLSHNQLNGGDELLLTNRQIRKIEKSKIDGTGTDIKISINQMKKTKWWKFVFCSSSSCKKYITTNFENSCFSALSGAVSGGIEKAIKGEGLFKIPQNKVYELKQYKNYLTDSQKKQINKALKTGSGISRFRMTKKQQEGGFRGSLLASIGIILLMNALTGKGLHVGPHLPTNTRNIYVPKTGRGKKNRQRFSSREKQSVQQYSNNRSNIVSRSAPRDKVVNIEKPLSSIDLNKLIKELNIKKFRGIFSRDNLPKRIRKEECGIINLDDWSRYSLGLLEKYG